MAFTLDFHQVYARKVAETGLLDCLSYQWSVGLNEHLCRVLAWIFEFIHY